MLLWKVLYGMEGASHQIVTTRFWFLSVERERDGWIWSELEGRFVASDDLARRCIIRTVSILVPNFWLSCFQHEVCITFSLLLGLSRFFCFFQSIILCSDSGETDQIKHITLLLNQVLLTWSRRISIKCKFQWMLNRLWGVDLLDLYP